MTDPKEKNTPIRTRTPGRLSGGMFDRVKLPIERHPIEEIILGDTGGSSPAPGSLPAPGDESAPRNISTPGNQIAPGEQSTPSISPAGGTSSAPGDATAPGRSSAPRSSSTPRRRPATRSSPAGVTRPSTVEDISPKRDFTKTANSIVREALSRGLFRGKSRDIYDYLYSKTRGAIVPRLSALLTSTEIMRGANIGSDHTLRDNLRHLQLVGLVDRKINSGAQDGNEYFVYLPEEVSLPFDREGNPLQLTSPPQVASPGHRGQELPGVPGAESAGGAPGSSSTDSATSGPPKTSFKTKDEKLDDEALAGLVSVLKQVAEEVTGKRISAAEAERWKEVGELLADELRLGASRTTVSSPAAFLAEHLRRRLARQPASQPAAKAPATAPAEPPAPPTDDELVDMFTGFLHTGMTLEELDGQLSTSIDAERWPRIRAAALERYERERGQMRPPDVT